MYSALDRGFSSLLTFISSFLSFTFVSHIILSPSPPPCLPLFLPCFVVFYFLTPFQGCPFSPFLFIIPYSLLDPFPSSSAVILLFVLPRAYPEDKRVALCRTICIFQSLHPPYHSFPYKYQFPSRHCIRFLRTGI